MPSPPRWWISSVCTRPRSSTPPPARGTATAATGVGSGTVRATTRSSRTCTRPARSSAAPPSPPQRRSGGRRGARVQRGGRAASRDARAGERVLRLRRPRRRDRVAAGPGAERVAYVDVDVHHGDGPQAIFWDDPRVLTDVDPRIRARLGSSPGRARPTNAAVPTLRDLPSTFPLPPGTGDAGWLAAFRDTVPAAVREFAPDVLVTQLGCDTHRVRPARAAPAHDRQRIGEVPRSCTNSRTARPAADGSRPAAGAIGGRSVVPRAWTLCVRRDGRVSRATCPTTLPNAWVEHAAARAGEPVPTTFSEPSLAPHAADEGRTGRRRGRRPSVG